MTNSDLIARLRKSERNALGRRHLLLQIDEAANALTAAQERIEVLEGALTRMIEWAEGPMDRFGPMIRQARAALDATGKGEG